MNAWGDSFGVAWGSSWGSLDAPLVPLTDGGGIGIAYTPPTWRDPPVKKTRQTDDGEALVLHILQ